MGPLFLLSEGPELWLATNWQTEKQDINSEGFLAEVFHPWVRWEGPGSGFENSSGGAGGVWKSRIHRFGPLGIEVEKQGFRTAWLITGQKFP